MSQENDIANSQDQEQEGKGCGIILLIFIIILLCLLFLGISSAFNFSSTGGQSTYTSENGLSGEAIPATPTLQPPTPTPQQPDNSTAPLPTPTSSFFISTAKEQEIPPLPPSSSTIQNAAACAASIQYSREINNHWDIWDLAFYTTYNTVATNECLDFSSSFTETSLTQYMNALGISWWTGSQNELPLCDSLDSCSQECAAALNLDPSNYYSLNNQVSSSIAASDRPYICIAFQNSFLAQELSSLITTNNAQTRRQDCLSGALPSSICDSNDLNASQTLCAQSLNPDASPAFLSTFETAREYFAINNGDLSNTCLDYLVEYLWYANLPSPDPTIYQQAVACLNSPETCPILTTINPSVYHQEANICAQNLGWAQIDTPEDQKNFLEYLIISIPWLTPQEIPLSCQSLIHNLAVDNGGYWQTLTLTLAANSSR